MISARPLLSIDNLTLSRDTMAVVKDGHLVINKGEIVCLMGANGSGKTTLAEMLAGLPQGYNISGSVFLNGSDLLAFSLDERARQGLYLAFQNVPEFDAVTAETFLYEAYAAYSGSRPARGVFQTKLKELCAVVGLPYGHVERPLFKGFSGGERKRLQLLELLLLRPQLSILDELDAGLDVQGLELLVTVVRTLRTEKPESSFLIITHNQAVVEALMPDRSYELINHTIVEKLS